MADQVKDAAAFCADLVRSHDFPRYASTLFLPGVHRRPMLAIYAFNVEISRVRDQVSQPLPGQMRLQWWTNLPRDPARRQVFLPQQFLQQHGSSVEEVFAGKQTPQNRAAVDQLVEEASKQLKPALALLKEGPVEVQPAFLPLALVRRDIKRMQRRDNDPFVLRRMPRFRMLWALWRASRSPEFRGGGMGCLTPR